MPAKKKEQTVVVVQESTPMQTPDTSNVIEMGQLLNIALEKGSNIETLERVMKFYEQGQEILAKQQFNHAFAAFQRELPSVKKSKVAQFPTQNGGMMRYTYASIDDVVQAVQPVLHKHGLSYWFEQDQQGDWITVTCHLSHISGHSIHCQVKGPKDGSGKKNLIQQISSTLTYLRRIALVGILGVACTDDDVDGFSPDVETPAAAKPAAYSDEDFQRNLPDWTTRIESGRNTADDIIINMNSKAPATPQQVKHLKSIQQKKGN